MKRTIARWLHKLATKIGGPPPAEEGRRAGAGFVLVNSTAELVSRPRTVGAKVCQVGGAIEIHVDGYGPILDGKSQELMTLEIWDGRLRLIFWPSHSTYCYSKSIDLENARHSARTRVTSRV